MAVKIGSLILDMRANTTKFIQGMSKSKKSVGKLSKGIGKLKGAIIALAGAGGFALIIKRSVDAADAIGKNAAAIGLTAEAYQELAHAADLAGTDQAAFTSNMTAFVKRVGDARNGVGPLVSGLRQYNSELLNNLKNSKGQEQALDILSNAIQNAGDAADRAALANAAFGRSGVHMSNLLKQGAKGIDKVTKRARELGLVLSNESIVNAELLKDRMTDLGKILSTKVTKAVVENAKAITKVTEAAISAIGKISTLIQFFQKLEGFGAFIFQDRAVDKLNSKIEASQRRLETANRLFIKKQRFFETDSRKERQKEELEAEVAILNNLNRQLEVQDSLRTSVLLRKDATMEIVKSSPSSTGSESDNVSFALVDKMKEGEARRLEALQASLLSEREIITESLIDKSFIIENSFESELINAETRASLLTKIEKDAAEERLGIDKDLAANKIRVSLSNINAAASIANKLSGLARSEGNKETKRSRELAKISIGISTAKAIMSALAVEPYYVGVALAADAALRGQQQLSKVGGGGSVGNVGSVSNSNPITQQSGVTDIQQGQNKATQVVFIGDNYEGSVFSEKIVEILQNATNDRDIVVFDGNSRQAQEIRDTV